MAVKMINADTLRAALGADATLQARVDSIHKAACARVKRYALGAPVEVRNEAIILLSAWVYQATAQSRATSSRPTKRDRRSTCRARSC